MNTASLELCKELYELSGWDNGWYSYWGRGIVARDSTEQRICPAYDLGYLLRKLPQNTWVGYVDTSGRRDYAQAKTYAWNEQGNDIIKVTQCSADTPEDAACKLAIELCTRDMLRRES
jgi:hypothetical protein